MIAGITPYRVIQLPCIPDFRSSTRGIGSAFLQRDLAPTGSSSAQVSGKQRKLWAIILAGGDGRRLGSLTTNADGVSTPKQDCSQRSQTRHGTATALPDRAFNLASAFDRASIGVQITSEGLLG
jgi:hypothetical protein